MSAAHYAMMKELARKIEELKARVDTLEAERTPSAAFHGALDRVAKTDKTLSLNKAPKVA